MGTISWQDALTNAFTNDPYLQVKIMSSSTNSQGTIVIPTSDTVTAATVSPSLAGLMRYITIVTPNMEGTGTATIRIVDAAGGTLFSQGQNESVTAAYGSLVPLTTTMKLTATADGTQSAAATITYNIYYDR